MELLKKHIDLDALDTLYNTPFTQESLQRDFEVKGGAWHVRGGWLIGEHRQNTPGMVLLKKEFPGNVVLDFYAKTVLPSTHDINVMWSGSWDEQTNTRGLAYVAGLEGWWDGKVGFEKSPDYQLNAATQYLHFKPGRAYHIQCGSLNGHVFVLIDGVLALEVTDPDPIDPETYGRVGFEAYCSRIAVTKFAIKRAVWQDTQKSYAFEA